MQYQKMFVFDPQDLLRLCTHYWDGLVPLNAEPKNVLVSPYLERVIAVEAESDEWEDANPLVMRYFGKKVMAWSKGDGQEHPRWDQKAETPTRQD